MQDPAGLLLGTLVDGATLQPRQLVEHPEREVRSYQQGHIRREKRVASEQRHEPRRTSGDHRQTVSGRVEQPQRPDVGQRLAIRRPKRHQVGAQGGCGLAPLRQPIPRRTVARVQPIPVVGIGRHRHRA